MAKRKQRGISLAKGNAAPVGQQSGIGYKDLAKDQQKAVDAIRKPILETSAKFGIVRETIAELAPRVMRVFNQIKAAHDRFTFVEFARMYDPKMPTTANGPDGYKVSKVYYTLDYIRRQSNQRPRGTATVRDVSTDALARAIATILQVVDQPKPLWNAIQNQFGFKQAVLTRLQNRVAATKPLVRLTVKRGVAVVGDVIDMPHAVKASAADEGEGEELSQSGRRVKRA